MEPRLRAAIDEALRDPEIAQLVREVDRSLLAWTASLDPFERVRVANERLRTLRRFVRVSDATVAEATVAEASDAPSSSERG